MLPSPMLLLKQFQSAVMKDDPELAQVTLTKAVSLRSSMSQFTNFREFLIHHAHVWTHGVMSELETYVTTSLMACVFSKALKVASVLLQQEQVDPMRRMILKSEDGNFHRRQSCLHLAAYLGHANMLVLLMDHLDARSGGSGLGWSVTWKDKREDTPLHLAAAGSSPCHTECVRVLVRSNLSRGVLSKLSQRNKDGQVPAELAAKMGHTASLAILLELYDAPVTSCVSVAAKSGAIEALKLLISKGGSCSGEAGRTSPLALAAANGHLECCQVLVEGLLMSPSASAFSSCLSEALCAAASACRPAVLLLLMDAVADHGGASLCSKMLCSYGPESDTPIVICAREPVARLECLQKLLVMEVGPTAEPNFTAPLPLRQSRSNGKAEAAPGQNERESRLRGSACDLLRESRREGGGMALPLSLLQGREGYAFANTLLRVGGVSLLDHPDGKFRTPLMFLLSHLSAAKSVEKRRKISEGLAWLLTWPQTTTTELFFTQLERELFGKVGQAFEETGAKRSIRNAMGDNTFSRWINDCDAAWLANRAFRSGLSLDQEVTLVCGDGEKLVCHRSVLVTEVDILRSMLATPMQEGIDGEIRLAEFSSSAVAMLLDFAYGFAIPTLDVPVINLETGGQGAAQVRVLLEALSLSHYLMYMQMFVPVAMQVARNMSPENVLQILQTAGALLPDTKRLDIAVRSYILRHFQMIQECLTERMSGRPNCRDLAVYILTTF